MIFLKIFEFEKIEFLKKFEIKNEFFLKNVIWKNARADDHFIDIAAFKSLSTKLIKKQKIDNKNVLFFIFWGHCMLIQ